MSDAENTSSQDAGIQYLDQSSSGATDGLVLAEQVVDASVPPPKGTSCTSCAAPMDRTDRFCTSCGSGQINAEVVDLEITEESSQQYAEEQAGLKHLRCENCGAEVSTDVNQRSYTCAFCDSTYVVEFSPDVSGRQRPEFVIGFALTLDQAMQKFRVWIDDNAWFRPGDLKTAEITEKMKGVYLPFWSFSMLANSEWHAEIGEHWYRRESYWTTVNGKRVRRTRTVTETEWWPLSGRHHHYHSGYLVSGSKGLSQADADRIKPFHLPALKRYEPYYLAGWLCEEYSVGKDAALQTSQNVFYQREQQNVAAFMPGDKHRRLQMQTTFTDVNSDLCLLPIFILSYKYNDKLYRFLVNGQTGRCDGDKPVSKKRIGVAIGIGVAVVAAIVLGIALAGGM